MFLDTPKGFAFVAKIRILEESTNFIIDALVDCSER